MDSSGWLEYLADASNGAFFATPLLDVTRLIVPSVCILEVYKKTLRERGEIRAREAAALMLQGEVVDLGSSLAFNAAVLGNQHKLPLADSIIYATARAHDATLWTQDAHFEGLPGVRYTPKRRS